MSYYECLCAIFKYLNDNIIPTLNEHTEEIKALMNWFENLDVQDEIDHKLDEMVESGELQEIISEYLNSTAVFGFDTVADMTSATNLINGSYAKTLGYYEVNDGGAATYKIRTITNEDIVDGGSIIAMDDETLIAELIIDRYEINVQQFGVKGNGVDDDSVYIQNAIDYASKLIETKPENFKTFGGNLSIILPAKKLYLKTAITCNNAINLIGAGTGSVLVLNANIDKVINYYKTNSKTTNEETQVEGLQIRNIRFDGNKRQYTCTAFLSLYYIDHGIFDNLYFYCVKGKSIELKGVRESNFTNLFTRFCGVVGSGDIEVIENVGGDTSNLNFGSNWNIIFPFGSAIKLDHGEFTNINNLIIHNLWQNYINQLETIFGVNDYSETNHNMIELDHSNLTISNGLMNYCPKQSVYVNMSESTLNINDFDFTSHVGASESHNDGSYFFNITSNSVCRLLSGARLRPAYQSADLYNIDSTSKLYGYNEYTSPYASYLKSNLNDYKRASRFGFYGERGTNVKLGFINSESQKYVSSDNVRSWLSIGDLLDDTELPNLISDKDFFFVGTNRYNTRGIVGVGDGSVLRLPQVEQGGVINISNALYVASDGTLKFVTYDGENYTTHNITMS